MMDAEFPMVDDYMNSGTPIALGKLGSAHVQAASRITAPGIRHPSFDIPLKATVFAIYAAVVTATYATGGVDAPPPPAPPSEPHFTQAQETRLDNGLRVIVAERPGLPLVAAQVVIGIGAEADPSDLAGTASMAGTLLSKGTESMTAPQIAEAIESLGGDISSGAGWDSSSASLLMMSDKLDFGLIILADVVLHPAF